MAFLRRLPSDDTDSDDRPLPRRITSIGAGPGNDLRFDEPSVADDHATITCDGPHFTIRPVRSDTPVAVNGSKVRKKRVLEHGDEIAIGDLRCEFRQLRPPESDDVGSELSPDDRRRLEGLERIHELSLTLLKSDDLEDLLEQLIDSAIALTDADKGFLVLADDDGWTVRVARNIDADTLADDDHRLSDSVLRHVLETRRPLVIADARNDTQFGTAQSVINFELCSVLCVPLLDAGELLGAVYVGNDRVTDLFDDLDLELLSIFAAQLSLVVSNAILLDTLRRDKQALEERLEKRRFGSLIGASEVMEPVFHAVDRVAPTDVTVLITGETGTGKELVATELHHRSNRADGPLVTLNCGAIPEQLLESELFGHVKGAFTGADSTKDGKFHAADGGTIFLDEIGEMPLDLQVKLLRALQERSISRIGANESEDIDIRILAATNRNLKEQVADGAFREDLFYRLNVVEIELPPLRERGEDVVLIARYLLDQLADELDTASRQFSRDALRAMRTYEWPGNIRQLENRLKKALVLSTGTTVGPADLDLPTDDLPEIKPLAEAKEEFALDYVKQILAQNDGNRSQTARDLDVDPRTVFRYLEKASES